MESGGSQEKKIYIPFDLTVDIISRLPVKSLVRFQIVSKLWSSHIIDTIVARSSTQPGLFLIFPHWLLQTSLLTSSTHSVTYDNPSIIAEAKDVNKLGQGEICDFEYQYIRQLICSTNDVYSTDVSRSNKRLLPSYNYRTNKSPYDGFLGYDPTEKQLFTLLGGLKKQQWERLNIQGIRNRSPKETSTGLCINGIIYYIASLDIEGHYDPEYSEIEWFDVKFEKFGHIKMPIMTRFQELLLVNYKGKLGCLHYNQEYSAEMWILEDYNNEEQEWSKVVLCLHDSLFERLRYGPEYGYCIAGATPNGEIVTMPRTLKPAQSFDAWYYDHKHCIYVQVNLKRFRRELISQIVCYGFINKNK